MVSTYTPNINLEEPARGDYVGTWDTPVNGNTTVLDLVVGGVATIGLNNSNVVLSAAQFRCATLIFNSTLTGSVTITLPTSFQKTYQILNNCTGSSAFTVTLATTAAASSYLCAPPGMMCTILNFNNNVTFAQLGGPIGSYWDYAGSSVPAWVSGSAPAPYVNCDGTTFSSATYPQLAVILGSTTLPDSKGRVRMALDQSAGRVSSGVAGFSPNTVAAGGGDQNMPIHTHAVSDPGHLHTYSVHTTTIQVGTGSLFTYVDSIPGAVVTNTGTGLTGIAIQTAGTGSAANVQPTYVGGLTLIRAG